MDTFLADLRYGFRRLLGSPTTTIVAVLSLALGIGANATIFSGISSLLLKPLPFADPNRIVDIYGVALGTTDHWSISYPNMADLRARNRTMSEVGAFVGASFNVASKNEPEHISGLRTTAPLFDVLGVEPELGRTYTAAEDRPGAGDRVAVISHALWARRFASDPRVVGQTISLNGEPHTVIGVMPEGFQYPGPNTEIWVPLRQDQTTWNRASGGLTVVGRVRPGVAMDQALADVEAVGKALEAEYPEANAKIGMSFTPMFEDVYSASFRLVLYVLMGAVAFVLLIACINVANVLLSRYVGRQREISIRTALGAHRARVVRLLLTESLLLAGIGGTLGVLAATWGVTLLRKIAENHVLRGGDIALDGRVLAFSIGITLLAGLLFGIGPAIYGSRTEISRVMQEGARGSSSGAAVRARHALIVTEVALALVLLIGGGLLVRTLTHLTHIDPGFEPDGLLTFQLSLNPDYEKPEQVAQFHQRLQQEIASMPGVSSVGAADFIPLGGTSNWTYFTIEGHPAPSPDQRLHSGQVFATPGYFEAMGIRLRRGRLFSWSDVREVPGVAVINERAAQMFFGKDDPLGKRIVFNFEEGEKPYWRTVVGVVADVRHNDLRAEPRPEIYAPYAQLNWPMRLATVVVRTPGDPSALAGAIRQRVLRVDASQPIYNIQTMREMVDQNVAISRIIAWMLAIFGLAALLLAGIGLYGVIAYSVAQRTREIGIRIALGAAVRDILRMVVAQGMRLVLGGVAIGTLGALALTRILRSQLYEVSPTDPVTFLAVLLVLGSIAALAAFLPARRATRVDPMEALRTD